MGFDFCGKQIEDVDAHMFEKNLVEDLDDQQKQFLILLYAGVLDGTSKDRGLKNFYMEIGREVFGRGTSTDKAKEAYGRFLNDYHNSSKDMPWFQQRIRNLINLCHLSEVPRFQKILQAITPVEERRVKPIRKISPLKLEDISSSNENKVVTAVLGGHSRQPSTNEPDEGFSLAGENTAVIRRNRNHISPCRPATSVEWGKPGVIEAELMPVPEFEAEVLLPDPLREWIKDEADRMPCPVEFVAVASLAALGSVVGTQCAILPKLCDVWFVIANLWGAIVGLPSAKKSPAISAGLKPLEFLVAKQSQQIDQELKRYEAYQVVQEAREEAVQARIRAAAKDRGKGDPDQLIEELLELKQEAAVPPTGRRFKTNDSTIEKLGEILQDNRWGVLVLRDELTGLLSSMDKIGHEGDRAFYLEAWNGTSSYDTDRIGRGSIHIPYLCLTVFGGIQPDKLLAYLEYASHSLGNDGLLQRLQLLVYPDHHPWQWRDRAPNKDAQTQAFRIYEMLANFDPTIWGAAPPDDRIKFPHFCFDEEAQGVFKAFATELHQQKILNESQPIIAQHLAKYDKLFPALALLFHLIDCAAGHPSPRVSAASAERAAAWCEFLEAHARRCYGLLVDNGIRAAQTLAIYVRQGKLKDGFTVRDVRRNQWRHLTTTEMIQSALEWLEDENHVRPESVKAGPRGGRPTTVYRINPALLTVEKKKQ